jgi:hypothetical protein
MHELCAHNFRFSPIMQQQHNFMIEDSKQALWASIERLKTALAPLSATDRTNVVEAMLGKVEARLDAFVRGPSSSDASGDNGGHMLDGRNAPNNDGVQGFATFGATTASTFQSDPPLGIVGVPASRYATRTSDASTLTTSAGAEDDGDEGHMFDGHNTQNNDGVQGFATFGATTASTFQSDPPLGIVGVPASRYATCTSDAFTLTMSAGDEDEDEDEDGEGQHGPC